MSWDAASEDFIRDFIHSERIPRGKGWPASRHRAVSFTF